MDAAIAVSADDLAAAIELGEAVYGVVAARLEHRPLKVSDVDLINSRASQRRLTPRLDRGGSINRDGAASQLLASLGADLLDLLAAGDIEKVKSCAHPDCTRLYLDSSRGKNRHWCGMSTCGNKVKVQAFRARQRTAAGALQGSSAVVVRSPHARDTVPDSPIDLPPQNVAVGRSCLLAVTSEAAERVLVGAG